MSAIRTPLRQRSDLHQDIPAALFTGFDDRTFETLALWMGNAALSPQRDEPCHAEFGQLLDEEISAVALGQRRSDFQVNTAFPNGCDTLRDFQGYPFFLNADDSSGVFGSVAIEQANGVTGAGAEHCGEMVRFGALEYHRPRGQRRIDVKPIGHVC